MKLAITSLALMAATLSSTVGAWSIYLAGATIARDAHDDVWCDSVYGDVGDNIKFYEGTLEDCSLGLYMDSDCEYLYASFDDDDGFELDEEIYSYNVKCGSW